MLLIAISHWKHLQIFRLRLRNESALINSVKPGQVWSSTFGNPFQTNAAKVTIVALKEGYVQYRYDFGGVSEEPLDMFVTVYSLNGSWGTNQPDAWPLDLPVYGK